MNVVLPAHWVDAGAFLAEVSGEEGKVAEGLDVIDAADVLGDAEGVVDGAEFGGAIPEGRLLDIGGGDFADFRGPLGGEFLEVGFELFELGAALGDEFLILKSFADDDVGHREEEGDIRSDADGEVKMREFCEAGFAGVGDDEFGTFGEGFFEAGGGDGVALGHVGADGEDGIGLVHVLEGVGHGASSDLSGQTGHGGSVSSTTAVVDMVGSKPGSYKLLHGVGGSVGGAPGGDAVDGVATVFCFRFRKSFGGFFEGLIPLDFLEGAVGLFDERFFEAVVVLDEIVSELSFDAEGSLVGGAVHCGLGTDDFIAFCQQVDGATDGAVGADGAGFFDGVDEVGGAEGLLIGKRSGGAGLDALAAEGAVGVAEVVSKFGGDLGVEPPIHHRDGVIAFLLGADADAAVAGNTVVVIAQDEGVEIVEIGGARLLALKAAVAGPVFVDEGGEFLGGKAAEGIDFGVLIFRGDHFEERLAHLLDLGWGGFDDHAVVCLCGAGGDGVADAFDLDNAETAAAEGIEAIIVAEGGDVFFQAGGDLVDGFAFAEGSGLSIDGNGESGRDGGIGIVDHKGSMKLLIAFLKNVCGRFGGNRDISELQVPDIF